MDRYIGLDVHSQSCTVAVMGPSGKRIREQRLETNGAAIREFVLGVPGRRHLCMEEGTQSEWLYEVLEPLVDTIVVTVPRKQRGSKSDSSDAWACADEVRRGVTTRIVYKAPGRFTALRQAVRVHQFLSRDLTRAKNRWRAVFRSRAIKVPSNLYSSAMRDGLLRKLPVPHRPATQLLGAQMDALQDAYEPAEQLLIDEAAKTPAVKLIATAPGIATVRASQIVSVVITPHRFRSKRQFWNYCGLAVVTTVTGEWKKKNGGGDWKRRKAPQTRGLNRNRHPMLKSAFKGAAQTVVTHMPNHPLHHAYQEHLKDGMDESLARLTLARKIAAAVLAMWKNKEEYDPKKHTSET